MRLRSPVPGKLSRIFSVPNALSLFRIPLATFIWLDVGSNLYLIFLMVLAAGSDMVDGTVARFLSKRRGEERADSGGIGAWLDPVCDKIFVVSLVAAVFWDRAPNWTFIFLVLLRELLQLPLLGIFHLAYREKVKGFDYRAIWAGKATTVAQFIAVGVLLFYPQYAAYPAWLSAGLGIIAVILISQRGIARIRSTEWG